jgi:hypothetical protein
MLVVLLGSLITPYRYQRSNEDIPAVTSGLARRYFVCSGRKKSKNSPRLVSPFAFDASRV